MLDNSPMSPTPAIVNMQVTLCYKGLSRLTTLLQAVGSDEGLDVEVIDPKAKVSKVETKNRDK